MNSILKRITHIPKIVFMNTGLCSYLAGWENARELQLSEVSGNYLETYIILDEKNYIIPISSVINIK